LGNQSFCSSIDKDKESTNVKNLVVIMTLEGLTDGHKNVLTVMMYVVTVRIVVKTHPNKQVTIKVISDAAQDGTCRARAIVPSGHGTTARAMKKN
jgi:hypothetical protein